MIHGLVRRDPSFAWLAWAVPLAAVLGFAAGQLNPAVLQVAPEGRPMPTPLTLIQAINLTLVLGFPLILVGRPQRRALPFQLTLPIQPRDLALSRGLAALLCLLLPAVGVLGAYAAVSGDTSSAGFQSMLRAVSVMLVAPFLLTFRLTPGERCDLPRPWLFWGRNVALIGGAQMAVAWWRPPLGWLLLGVAVVAALLTAISLRRLPRAFVLSSSLVVKPIARRELPRALRWLRRVPLVSPFAPLNATLRPDPLLWLNLMAVFAGMMNMVVMSVRLGNWYAMFGFPMFQVILVVFLVYGLPRVAHLPISRRRLFVQGAGPGLLLALITMALAVIWSKQPPSLAAIAASSQVAVAVAAWWTVWFLAMAAALFWFLPAAPTRRGRLTFWVTRWAMSAIAATPMVWANFLFEADHPGTIAARNFLDGVGASLASPIVAWTIAGCLAVAAYLGAEAMFARIQVTKLRDRLVIQKK